MGPQHRRRPRCSAAPPSSAAAQTALRQLLDAARGTERGVQSSEATTKAIMAAVEELKRAGAGSRTGAYGVAGRKRESRFFAYAIRS